MAYTYQLPFGPGRSWAQKGPLSYIIGGWELNGITTLQSGFPLNPGLSFNSCVCGSTNRPNLVGDPELGRSERTLDRFFDRDAYTLPALYTVGNSGTGQMYGPGLVNFNLAVSKRFSLSRMRDGANIEFRAEWFNLSNTPYFNDPNTTIGSADAGRILGATNSREMQMALKLYW